MRIKLTAAALALALVAPGAALAQGGGVATPPTTERITDQRLENVDMRLQQAAERLRAVAPDGTQEVTEKAKQQAQQSIREAYDVFDHLPPEQRTAYEAAFGRAMQAVQERDARGGAEAIATLRREVHDLLAGSR
jgi:hypothetical protein